MSFQPTAWAHKRFEVFKRDCFRCVYCGYDSQRSKLELDHVIPRSDGGHETDINNLVTSCQLCNQGKWYISLSKRLPTLAEILTQKGRKIRVLRKQLEALKEIEQEETELLEQLWEMQNIQRKLK